MALAAVGLLAVAGCLGHATPPQTVPTGPAGPTTNPVPASSSAPPPPVQPPATKVLFGLDADSLALQQADGLAPHYSTLWVGLWNLGLGWRDTDVQLRQLRAAGVTPAIQLYYWDDQLSPRCIESGCGGRSEKRVTTL